jgi:hypothetical protein
MFDKKIDLSKYSDNSKFESWKQTLVRRSLIDINGKVLNQGKLILDNIRKKISRKEITSNITNEETTFDIWWKTYPSTDIFKIRAKVFKGVRKFKAEKDTCRQLFNRILNSGEYTAEELIEAIKLETENRMEESYKTGQNKLVYLQNTATYLRQYSFDAYVELIRKGFKSNESNNAISNEPDYYGGVAM